MYHSSCVARSARQSPVTTKAKWYYLNTRPVKSSSIQVVELDVIKESPNRLHVQATPQTNYHHYLRKDQYVSVDRGRLVQLAADLLKRRLAVLKQEVCLVEANIDQLLKEQ